MYKPTTCAFKAEPAADAKNHIPIICEVKAFGANFVVTDKPIGEINISPTMINAHEPTNQNGPTLTSVPNNVPGKAINKNDNAVKPSPKANFFGELGCFEPNFVHNQANNGTYNMMNNGLNDWNQAGANQLG